MEKIDRLKSLSSFTARNFKRLKYFKRNFYLTKDLYASSLKATYLGISLVKFPTDLQVLSNILWKVKPQLIIEIGTHEGGSALWMCHQMDKIRDDFEIHTIDIVNRVKDSRILNDRRIKRFLNGFESYPKSNVPQSATTLIIDDGSHVFEDIKEAFKLLSPMVSVGSYYIIEDGITEFPGISDPLMLKGGPFEAINEILQENFDFQEDTTVLEPWTSTPSANPRGYLRRI